MIISMSLKIYTVLNNIELAVWLKIQEHQHVWIFRRIFNILKDKNKLFMLSSDSELGFKFLLLHYGSFTIL